MNPILYADAKSGKIRRGPKRESYRTPLVLGISVPPVRSIACRRASARALKADSTLSERKLDNAKETLQETYLW